MTQNIYEFRQQQVLVYHTRLSLILPSSLDRVSLAEGPGGSTVDGRAGTATTHCERLADKILFWFFEGRACQTDTFELKKARAFMGSSDSDSDSGDKKATVIADAMRYRRSDHPGGRDSVQLGFLPKGRKDSADSAIRKRSRTEAPVLDVAPHCPPYGEDDSKMPWGTSPTTRQQLAHVPQPSVVVADPGALQQQSSTSSTLSSGGHLAGASLLERSAYAEHQIGMHGHSLFNQMQASSSAESAATRGGGGVGPYSSGFAGSLYSGLSPAARQFLLRDQLARNQQAAMLIAQMGGTQPYDPWLNPIRLQQQQVAAAMGDSRTGTASHPMQRQNFPASDMLSRYSTVLSGLPVQSTHQAEYGRGPALLPGDVNLVDQYRLHHHLNQLGRQQQPSPTMGQQLHHRHQQLSQLGQQQEHQQLFAPQSHPSPELRRFAAEQQQRFDRHQIGRSPPLPSNDGTSSNREASLAAENRGEAAGPMQQSPVSTARSRSTGSMPHRRDPTGDAVASQHTDQRFVPAAAAAAVIVRRQCGDVGDANDDDDLDSVELPPCVEGSIPPLASRRAFPLGIDEDTNWLSEFHCFVREDLIEVFRASHDDVKSRNTSIVYNQIGMRCRYCAHLTGSAKAGRSSAFPSSIRQIYQSFTMMLRDHFPNCESITGEVGERYTMLKDKPSQGATDSKRYWIYAGLKIGMADSKQGIYMTKETRREGLASSPFGMDPNIVWQDDAFAHVSLVSSSDNKTITEFLLLLVSQVQPIRLTEAECIGNRRSLRVGLPGFGCRYCCQKRRLGLGRMFPARRRTLPSKLFDFYDHIRRCPLCPADVQADLIAKKRVFDEKQIADQGADREFFDRVWTSLGHDTSPST